MYTCKTYLVNNNEWQRNTFKVWKKDSVGSKMSLWTYILQLDYLSILVNSLDKNQNFEQTQYWMIKNRQSMQGESTV